MEWIFFRDFSSRWSWVCRSKTSVLKQSRRAFGSRRECVVDAMRYGFVAGPLAAIEPIDTKAPVAEAVR